MSSPERAPGALKESIRQKYEDVASGDGAGSSSCCGADADTSAEATAQNGIAYMGESYDGVDGHTAKADLGLGCGLPTEVANLQPGEAVLDLGSGAGVDAFVARRAVGPEGRVEGVDFAPTMVKKARRNAADLGYENTRFHHGEIEALPVEDASFDVVVSNCVLNLVPSKEQAFAETYRALQPGGRFIVSDIVSVGALPEAIREAAELHAGCVAGALPEEEYVSVIQGAGFEGVTVAKERAIELPDEVLRPHLSAEDLRAFRASEAGLLSVTVTGTRPAAA
jgi:SAM-dependent methyltransferase